MIHFIFWNINTNNLTNKNKGGVASYECGEELQVGEDEGGPEKSQHTSHEQQLACYYTEPTPVTVIYIKHTLTPRTDTGLILHFTHLERVVVVHWFWKARVF